MNNTHKATIFYFSGTGNAKRIASWFSEFAVAKGIDCEIIDIAKCNMNNIAAIANNSLILIISPIHGFNYPKITLDFIRHFPKGNNRVVLLNTRAAMKIGKFVTPGLTGIAFMLSSLVLKTKGYKIIGQIPFDMPSNWLMIHPALNTPTVKYIHKVNYARVKKHSDKIFSGLHDFLAYRDLVQDILLAPISLGYYWVGRFVFAKSFYSTADCDNCGLCIKQCPVSAIKNVNTHPYWTFKCESCMQCMNICPQKSINTAHALIVGTSILSSFGLTVLLHNILEIEIKSSFFRLLLESGFFLVLIWIFYYIQHLFLKNRIFSKLISFTSLTFYKFWGRYGSIPDSKWKE